MVSWDWGQNYYDNLAAHDLAVDRGDCDECSEYSEYSDYGGYRHSWHSYGR